MVCHGVHRAEPRTDPSREGGTDPGRPGPRDGAAPLRFEDSPPSVRPWEFRFGQGGPRDLEAPCRRFSHRPGSGHIFPAPDGYPGGRVRSPTCADGRPGGAGAATGRLRAGIQGNDGCRIHRPDVCRAQGYIPDGPCDGAPHLCQGPRPVPEGPVGDKPGSQGGPVGQTSARWQGRSWKEIPGRKGEKNDVPPGEPRTRSEMKSIVKSFLKQYT